MLRPSPYLLVSVLVLAVAQRAYAQHDAPGQLTVVVDSSPARGRDRLDSEHAITDVERRWADVVEDALNARKLRVVSRDQARARVQAISRAPVAPTDAELVAIAQESKDALTHARAGRRSSALRSVHAALERAEHALEGVNRDPKYARRVLDACLVLVRDALARAQRSDALAEAMRCRRLVPDLAPSEMYHAPSVIDVLSATDEQLRQAGHGRLHVRSVPQSGCGVYVNGRRLGVTPFQLERAAVGEYRVQVECEPSAGRVHVVQLSEAPSELAVDLELDRALRSDARLSLVYADGPIHEPTLAGHASQLGKLAHSEEVVSMQLDGKRATLHRVRSSDAQLLARVHFSTGGVEDARNPELLGALVRLFEGRLDTESALTVAALSAAAPEPAEATEVAPPHARDATAVVHDPTGRALTATVAMLGAGAFATGVAFEIVRARAETELADGELGASAEDEQWDRYRQGQALRWLGAVGGTLLSATAPLSYLSGSQAARPPKWSYAALAAGLGLLVWGSYEIARPSSCRVRDPGELCQLRRDTDGRGALAVSAAAPLLSFSLTYMIGAHIERARRIHVSLAPTTTSLALVMRKEL